MSLFSWKFKRSRVSRCPVAGTLWRAFSFFLQNLCCILKCIACCVHLISCLGRCDLCEFTTNWEQRCVSRSQRSEVGLQRCAPEIQMWRWVGSKTLTEMQMQCVEFQPRQKVEFAPFSRGSNGGTKNFFFPYSFSPCFWNGNTWVKVTSGSQVLKMLLKCWAMENIDCLRKKKQLAQLTFSILTITYCNPSHLDAHSICISCWWVTGHLYSYML